MRAAAYGIYDGVLRDLIHLLKFDQVRPSAPVLGQILASTIWSLEASLPSGAITVIPVPLHARKQSDRGFNQAERISHYALKEIGLPERFVMLTGALLRRRETGSQIGLTRNQRRENLRGAFAVKNPAEIANRNILLVDDVYTSGATASECTRVLKRAGASNVWIATVARTLKISDLLTVPDFSGGREKQEQIEHLMSMSAEG